MRSLIEKQWHGIALWECPYCRLDFQSQDEAHTHLLREHQAHEPSVTAVMVTNRPEMAKRAAFQFAAQSWGRKRLVVVSPLAQSLFRWADLEFVFVKAKKNAAIGAMRQAALGAVETDYVTHWDDDEIYHPRRIEAYLEAMNRAGIVIGGVERHLYTDGRSVWRYDTRSRNLTGATLTYLASAGREAGFRDIMVGEDEDFVNRIRGEANWVLLPEDYQISLVHRDNTSPKPLSDPAYQAVAFWHPRVPEKVALAVTTWEDGEIGLENVELAARETMRWRALGTDALLIVADSGSGDNYRDRMRSRLAQSGCPYSFITNSSLRGVSVSRNQILDEASKEGVEFIVFVDGDITVIPWSTISLVWELAWMPDVACLGLWSGGYRSDGPPGTWPGSSRLVLNESRDIAWTQYGAFRMEAFQDVRFETEGPFREPGYGLEDVDIAWEFERRGWRIRHLTGLSYLHRSRSSSVRRLLVIGVDAADAWKARFDFLAAKWRGLDPYESRLHALPRWSPS